MAWLALSLGACAPVVSQHQVLSFHTLQAGPDQDVDVLWVQQFRTNQGYVLMRCYNSPEGPTCVRASTP